MEHDTASLDKSPPGHCPILSGPEVVGGKIQFRCEVTPVPNTFNSTMYEVDFLADGVKIKTERLESDGGNVTVNEDDFLPQAWNKQVRNSTDDPISS